MCVGLDTHKAKIAVAVAEPGRSGEVRFAGEIANRPDAVRRLIERLWGRLKEWRAVATRYEKTAASFLSVLCLAATIGWIKP